MECHICSVVQFFALTSARPRAESPAHGLFKTPRDARWRPPSCSKRTHLLGNAYLKVFRAVSANRAWKRAPAADQRAAIRTACGACAAASTSFPGLTSVAKFFAGTAKTGCAERRLGRWYDMDPSVDVPRAGQGTCPWRRCGALPRVVPGGAPTKTAARGPPFIGGNLLPGADESRTPFALRGCRRLRTRGSPADRPLRSGWSPRRCGPWGRRRGR